MRDPRTYSKPAARLTTGLEQLGGWDGVLGQIAAGTSLTVLAKQMRISRMHLLSHLLKSDLRERYQAAMQMATGQA